MISNPAQFAWKNFNLNIELHISGNFIYNGIYLIDRYHQLRYEDDCFMLLYDISVGIERLEKIVYLLLARVFSLMFRKTSFKTPEILIKTRA